MPSTNCSLPTPEAADWRSAGLCYHTLNFFCQKKFGTKVRKLCLDAGCTCPNRDGTLATSGCIFCDPESFSPSRRTAFRPVAEQIEDGIRRFGQRNPGMRFLAYFQPGTNTYGPAGELRSAYQQVLHYPEIVGMVVGTRPDCATDESLGLLAEIAAKTWVVVEYGLQTVHDRTLDLLNRGHHYDAFVDAYRRTRLRNLDVSVHAILGLPGESREDMLATVRTLAQLEIHSVKLHNLYAVRNTVLAQEVTDGRMRLPEFAEYVGWVVDFLEELPGGVVVDRLSGDAPAEYLVGPDWCLDKAAIRTAVEQEFRRRGSWQGCRSAGGAEGLRRSGYSQ